MSRRRPKNYRLPSMPEGDARDEAIRQLAGKMATVRDVERLLQAYDAQYIVPLRERLIWLDFPLWKRVWIRSGLEERWSKLRHRVLRWRVMRRFRRLERHQGDS